MLLTTDSQGNFKEVHPSQNEKCLGGRLQSNLTWNSMLLTGEDALIPLLRKKLGLLKYLGKNLPQKSKLILANSLLIGKINYLLPVYGGAPAKYLKKIQCVMNNAVRFITGARKRDKTATLMNSVNWLNIGEMMTFHTLTFTWKTLHLNTPRHIAENIYWETDNTIYTRIPRLKHSSSSLRWRMCQNWNSLPLELRSINSFPRFKSNVKKWIKTQRPPLPPDPGQNTTAQHRLP